MVAAAFTPASAAGPTTYLIHTDHLGGTNQYFSFAAAIGKPAGVGVGLTYAGARHYDGVRGRHRLR